jgi:hypothetical protein
MNRSSTSASGMIWAHGRVHDVVVSLEFKKEPSSRIASNMDEFAHSAGISAGGEDSPVSRPRAV